MNRNVVLLHALADPIRLRAMALLRQMELSVGELAQVLAHGQPAVSKHLKILLDCGLVSKRKEGNWVFLGLGEPGLVDPAFTLLDRWAEVHGESSWIAADLARLTAINADRAQDAAQYFRAHAAEWDRLRSLHIPTDKVDSAILRALGDHHPGQLVDIGTGTGTMLMLFAHRADHMIGIDRSPDMLRFGRAKLAEAGIVNAELRQGDMNRLDLPTAKADTVILHQVLHYSRSPATAIAEAARLLKPSGRLLVIDVAPHHVEALRKDHAHVRLGFADDEVLAHLAAAGIDGAVVDHLTGGDLTVTIWIGKPNGSCLKLIR